MIFIRKKLFKNLLHNFYILGEYKLEVILLTNIKKYKKILLFRCLLFFILFSFLVSLYTPSKATETTPYIINDDLIFDSNLTINSEIETDIDFTNISIEGVNNSFVIKDINGNILNNNSIIVKLPDEKLLLKYPNQSIKTYNWSGKNLPIPEQTEELNKSSKKIKIDTKIETFDEYKLTYDIEEIIENQNLIIEGTEKIKISWGDGTYTIANLNNPLYRHTYKKSGKYPISITIDSTYNSTNYTFVTTNNVLISEPSITQLPIVTIKSIKKFTIEEHPKETATVATAGIGTATILGFIVTETGKYKLFYLLSLAIPLYTRVQKEDILDQFVRGQIYAIIKTNPGIHYNKIMEKIDVKNGTLSYHLHMLEKTDMIKSRKEGFRYRAFYPSNIKFPKNERYRLTELQTKIIDIIKSEEGVTQKLIAEKLKEKPQTISYNLKVLQQADLVKMNKKGRKKKCYLGNNFSDNQKESP